MKKQFVIWILLSAGIGLQGYAQDQHKTIRTGNRLYKEGQYEQAQTLYQQAAASNPSDAVARYNLGNALYRNNQFAEAEREFEAAVAAAPDKAFAQKAWYNKGLALSKQKKLEESIEAWKQALRLDPNDEDARANLQKALSELNRRQQNQQQQRQQPQQQQRQQQQRQQQNKLDRRKIEQYLESLRQKEQEVHRKIKENRTRSVNRPDKDW